MIELPDRGAQGEAWTAPPAPGQSARERCTAVGVRADLAQVLEHRQPAARVRLAGHPDVEHPPRPLSSSMAGGSGGRMLLALDGCHPCQPLSLLLGLGKEGLMDVAATVTSKGQVTVPKAVRDALGIVEGDEVVFRVEGKRAVLARTPRFLELAGSVRVPAAKRNVAWDEVLRRTRVDRAEARR